MSARASMIARAGTAKLIGFVIGFVGFLVVIPYVWPDESLWFRFGFWMWYTTFGALIGVLGVLDRHPLLGFGMPFWFRGILFGGWLNFVVVLLLYDKMSLLMQQLAPSMSLSPFLFAVEGMIVGLFIDWVATRVGGEGPALLARPAGGGPR